MKHLLLLLIFLSTLVCADGSPWGFKLGFYQPVVTSNKEFGNGLIFKGTLFYELQSLKNKGYIETVRLEYVHKSYLFDGVPFESSGVESTFDAVGFSIEF